MATSKQIIDAANDPDLMARFAALAAARGVPNPTYWVQSNAQYLVSLDLNGEQAGEDSVASVYEYAALTYEPTPRPGANLAAVTDPHIEAAIDGVLAKGVSA